MFVGCGHGLLYLEWGNFNNGSLVSFLRVDHVVEYRKEDHRTSHQYAIVHRRCLDRRSHRPEAEEENNQTEANREEINRNAENARQVKRTPDELIGFARLICAASW